MSETVVPRRGNARERLLTAANDLFARDGINTTGVEALASAAGVTKATLYNNFRSKDDVVVAYLQEKLDTTRSALAANDDSTAGPRTRVAVVFDTLIADITAGRFFGCPFAKAAVEVPSNAAAMAVVREHHEALVGHFTAITADPLSAETIAMLYDGAIIAVKATGSAAPVTHARDAALDLVA